MGLGGSGKGHCFFWGKGIPSGQKERAGREVILYLFIVMGSLTWILHMNDSLFFTLPLLILFLLLFYYYLIVDCSKLFLSKTMIFIFCVSSSQLRPVAAEREKE